MPIRAPYPPECTVRPADTDCPRSRPGGAERTRSGTTRFRQFVSSRYRTHGSKRRAVDRVPSGSPTGTVLCRSRAGSWLPHWPSHQARVPAAIPATQETRTSPPQRRPRARAPLYFSAFGSYEKYSKVSRRISKRKSGVLTKGGRKIIVHDGTIHRRSKCPYQK